VKIALISSTIPLTVSAKYKKYKYYIGQKRNNIYTFGEVDIVKIEPID